MISSKIVHKLSAENVEDDLKVSLLDNFFDVSANLGPDVVNKSKYNKLLAPFEIKYTYGFNVDMPLINLTNQYRREIFYSASNIGIFYDYCQKKINHVKGHQNKIVSASLDSSGRWLAVSDLGKDNAVMIWDTENRNLVSTHFNYPPEPSALSLVSMSPSAKLLITSYYKSSEESSSEGSAGGYGYYGYGSNSSDSTKESGDEGVANDGAVIDFWLWTVGKEEPDDSYVAQSSYGHPKAIEFHPNKEEHIMVIFEQAVVFLEWDFEVNKVKVSSIPAIPRVAKWGGFTDGTYVLNSHQSVAGSAKGAVFVFGNTLFAKPFEEAPLDNAKIAVTTIKISNGSINCIKSVDGFIIIGDSLGNILFFDNRVRLLYWFTKFNVGGVNSLSFALNPRKYSVSSTPIQEIYRKGSKDHLQCHNEDEDRTDHYEVLFQKSIPIDASLKKSPLVSRDFFMTSAQGGIYHVDFIAGVCTNISGVFDSTIAAIDVHDEMPYLLIAFKNGRITLYNYENSDELKSFVLPPSKHSEDEEAPIITAIKYSKFSFHLACGKSNGELWILHPLLFKPLTEEPFEFSKGSVEKIIFSLDAQQLAYYDKNSTVVALVYDASKREWDFRGKLRAHYKSIKNIIFTEEYPYNICTVGADRYLIHYNPIEIASDRLVIKTRDRIEQRDIPEYFILNRGKQKSTNFFYLLSDNKYKFKTLNQRTFMCTSVHLGPAHGCFRDTPVRKMRFLPCAEDKYLIFMNDKHIGLQLLPIDGNPYKYVGTVAHAEELLDFKISVDGKYIFTAGKNDTTLFMWDIRFWYFSFLLKDNFKNEKGFRAVETLFQLGGEELMPFFCLFEGGKDGWLFQEMQDLFYYMQILHQGENIILPRVVSDSVSIIEIPDLVRACGYYPTEYEIENMMTDIRYKNFDESGTTVDKITFIDFVKLFINHRPAHGYSLKVLEESFGILVDYYDDSGGLERDNFVEMLTTHGELYTIEHVHRCMTTLLKNRDNFSEECHSGEDFDYIPSVVDFEVITEDILGIDLNIKEEDLAANDAAKDLEEESD